MSRIESDTIKRHKTEKGSTPRGQPVGRLDRSLARVDVVKV